MNDDNQEKISQRITDYGPLDGNESLSGKSGLQDNMPAISASQLTSTSTSVANSAGAAIPNLTNAVEEIMDAWRVFPKGQVTMDKWPIAKKMLGGFFDMKVRVKKGSGLLEKKGPAAAGDGFKNCVMIVTPSEFTDPKRHFLADDPNNTNQLKIYKTPIIIFLENDGTNDTVATILIDENNDTYNENTMSERVLKQVFPYNPTIVQIKRRQNVLVGKIPLWGLMHFKNIILEGVPGTGKTHAYGEIYNSWKGYTTRKAHKREMTFHPSTSYEDFVIGIRPVRPATATDPPFAVQPGFMKRIVKEAIDNPNEDYLVLLDEFNRANVPKVLGDLLTVIESGKRAIYDPKTTNWISPISITLPLEEGYGSSAKPSPFFVPDNIYIIGTMNTTDRSVAPLDSALRRRFVFDRIEPMEPSDLEETLGIQHTTIAPTLIGEHTALWGGLNQWLEKEFGADGKLGHSYLFDLCKILEKRPDNSTALWQMLLLPQLNDILMNNEWDNLIEDFNNFMAKFSLEGNRLSLKSIGIGINQTPQLTFEQHTSSVASNEEE
ncbi:AAA family ATPase [Candidatus Poseidonia alphae]|nr:AAA family ATPase [Candidatus Poseidonia alphae]